MPKDWEWACIYLLNMVFQVAVMLAARVRYVEQCR